jgi:hypothetical protein
MIQIEIHIEKLYIIYKKAHGHPSGPDDPDGGLDALVKGRLLRDFYLAAVANPPDLDNSGDVLVASRRCAVLIRPQRFWSNPPGSEHLEPAGTKAASS